MTWLKTKTKFHCIIYNHFSYKFTKQLVLFFLPIIDNQIIKFVFNAIVWIHFYKMNMPHSNIGTCYKEQLILFKYNVSHGFI